MGYTEYFADVALFGGNVAIATHYNAIAINLNYTMQRIASWRYLCQYNIANL